MNKFYDMVQPFYKWVQNFTSTPYLAISLIGLAVLIGSWVWVIKNENTTNKIIFVFLALMGIGICIVSIKTSSHVDNVKTMSEMKANKQIYYHLNDKVNQLSVDITVLNHQLNEKTHHNIRKESSREVNMENKLQQLKMSRKKVAKKISNYYEDNLPNDAVSSHYHGIWYQRAKGADV